MTPTFQPSSMETLRINLLRALFLLLLPLILIAHAPLAETFAGELMENMGFLLVVGGVLGRAWSILYIGGKKNMEIVADGPYSICRHPLYLFSSISVLGFGLMLQSMTLTVAMVAIFGGTLYFTALREEERLAEMFPGYGAYARVTPAILPKLSNFRTEREVTFRVDMLRKNFWDAAVFLLLIPFAELLEWGHAAIGSPGLWLP